MDFDPTTGAVVTLGPGLGSGLDGVSVSPDGTVAYGEYNSDSVIGYSIASPNPSTAVFNSSFLAHSPDGTGAVSGGTFNGDIVVINNNNNNNNNNGTLGLIGPALAISDPIYYTIIADNGTRGDLVAAENSNGTLFLTQTEEVQRLSCGAGCRSAPRGPSRNRRTLFCWAPPSGCSVSGDGHAGRTDSRTRTNRTLRQDRQARYETAVRSGTSTFVVGPELGTVLAR